MKEKGKSAAQEFVDQVWEQVPDTEWDGATAEDDIAALIKACNEVNLQLTRYLSDDASVLLNAYLEMQALLRCVNPDLD